MRIAVFRILFLGLILFEFLNLVKILNIPLNFSWFGLMVTASFVWLVVELTVYFLKAREHLPIALGLSFSGVLLDVLGDIFHFYSRFGFYDRFLHLVVGAIIAYLLFILTKKTSPLFILGTVSLLGALYEIEEYLEDKFIHRRGLRLGDGPDTADDLLMNLLGALLVIFIFFFIRKQNLLKLRDLILNTLRRLIPESIFKFFQPVYHWTLGFLGALFYRFPSKKLIVIGVTGTKGKTTTCNLIAQILNHAGFKTGMATTVNFGIGEKEWINTTKQTMLGRFHLQKLLSEMVRQGCQYAVIETSSEGILQYRHRFVDYKIAVFTNLTPEHIERHGSFENYRDTKIKLFEQVAKKSNSIGVYNLDDKNVSFFLRPKIARQYVYTLRLTDPHLNIQNLNIISKIESTADGTTFLFNKEQFKMPLIGEMNVYNAAAAICVAISQGIPQEQIKKALEKVRPVPGRLEIVDKGQNFTVVIDYAHEPASLEAVYKTVKELLAKSQKSKIICLLGAQGGGRDKWKRQEMGKIAAKYCDKIVLANEDPYDEPPMEILNEIEKGISINQSNRHRSAVYKIIDRREAIKKALFLAEKEDVVILTGKGGEVWMCVEKGKKIPWDEKKIVEEELANLRKYGRKHYK